MPSELRFITTSALIPILPPLRIHTHRPFHQPRRPALPQLINSPYRINSRMQCPPRVEVLLNTRKQIPALSPSSFSFSYLVVNEGMGQRFVRRHSLLGVDGEAAFNEFAGGEGDGAPVFEGGEGVVGDEDCLHFFEVGVSVKGCVAAEEEVGYDAYRPDVSMSPVRDGRVDWCGERSVHRLAVPRLLEDLGGHVPRRTARCGQDVKRFFVHYS